MNILPKSHVTSLFDIRLAAEHDVVVIQGTAETAEPTWLKGKVVLCLTENVAVKNITLKLVGKRRIAWTDSPSSGRAQRVNRHDSVVYEKEWSFLPFHGSKTLRAGNYEYPFQVQLPGNITESVEGLVNCYVVYRLKAVIERPGLASKIVKKKHLRIIRSLPPDAVEFTQTVSVENTWPNKIEYNINVPTKVYAIGSYIPINIVLIPLLKGLTIGRISIALKEYITLSITHGLPATTDEVRTVCSLHTEELSEYSDHYEVNKNLQLPTSLTRCLQDCDIPGIKNRHKLRFTISLKNPDGHVSELRAALPVTLMIAPQLFGDPSEVDSLRENFETFNQPLPSYERSMYDRLYDGLSYSNVDTPLPSGANTPHRRNSIDPIGFSGVSAESHRRQLIAGLTALAQQQQQRPPPPIDFMPNGTEEDGMSAPSYSYHSRASSTANSSMVSRNPSETSLAELSRVPSYSEATRSSVSESPLQPALPSYEDVTRLERMSCPSSPNATTPPHSFPSSSVYYSPTLSRRSLDQSRLLNGSNSAPGSVGLNHSQSAMSLSSLAQGHPSTQLNGGQPHRPQVARLGSHRSALDALRRARMLPSSFFSSSSRREN
ncbi:arrestin/PY protein 1 [Schizosaccharomyces japonicus yFS275]|uniref:Arrestin/PY protein 1 n=1 Tax=Schizosaccharomyces japonicus (strain yFS275 / FY16936) TaxID=402676 RepID=B6JWM5_SCHJY|nr:arrestin/PY protein 1 [Schizosaccharomyces japonicus yFS275]EEB05776.1 arrestin/PY protein 1 [Schizosaccharomyces japonicus yFS275]